jgi:hypothetical protein
MDIREIIGLGFIVLGVVLLPIGLMFHPYVWVVAVIAIFIGSLLFTTMRHIRKSEEREFGTIAKGRDLPGDIYDHSGWGRGGRSEGQQSTVESHSSGEGGGP